jgi:hypothetical protein
MEPFNNDMAYSYLNGLISRREISFEEQKRHYETNKHLLDQAGDVIRSWMTGYRQTHVHSRDHVSSAYAPAKAHVSPRGSPAFYKEVNLKITLKKEYSENSENPEWPNRPNHPKVLILK